MTDPVATYFAQWLDCNTKQAEAVEEEKRLEAEIEAAFQALKRVPAKTLAGVVAKLEMAVDRSPEDPDDAPRCFYEGALADLKRLIAEGKAELPAGTDPA
jgi:hypothetical protein